jgi:carboxyl-terminal processing protease
MKQKKSCRRNAWATVGALALGACSGEDSGPPPLFDTGGACSLTARKAFVASLMSDFYLWYDRVPAVNWRTLSTPEQVLSAMTYREIDRWSGMQMLADRDAFYEEGRVGGFGYSLGVDDNGEIRIILVNAQSPAGRAGLSRGGIVVSVNGQPVADLSDSDLARAFAQAHVSHEVQELDGTVRSIELDAGEVDLEPVTDVKVFDTAAGPVGYFFFSTFIEPAAPALEAAFQQFKQAGVRELVVDLRYNGGGLLRIAGQLGSLIRQSAAGQPLITESYNNRHSDLNSSVLIETLENGLNLDRVVFLTTESSASASEQLINGLKPFMDVRVVGTRTYGKPVGADTWAHCNYAITPITFESVNAEGGGQFYDGIQPDCAVDDDVTRPFGDPEEDQLRAALDWLETGQCSQPAALHLKQPGPRLPARNPKAPLELPNLY